MILIERKSGRITLRIIVNRVSKYYLTEANNMVIVDEDYILHELYSLKTARVKKTGVVIINLTAITEAQRKNIITSEHNWIMKNAPRQTSGIGASLFTMLKNKGF